MGRQSLSFLLAVLAFWLLFGVPWPEGLGAFHPGDFAPLGQVMVGAAIIVLHWLANRKHRTSRREIEEGADASYFLGFIMTMLFLVFGLMQSQGGVDARWIAEFVHDMGVAFSFSVVGLTVRQLQVLRRAGDYGEADALPAPAAERIEQRIPSMSPAGHEQSAERMETVMRGFEERIGQTTAKLENALGTLDNPAAMAAFDRSLRALEQRVGSATERLGDAIDGVTQSTVRASMEIEGASSRLRGGLQSDMELLASEVARVVDEVAHGRARLLEVLASTTTQAEETQRIVATASRKQAAEWEEQMRATHAHLLAMRSSLEEELRQALTALDRSSTSLLALGDAVVERANQLPNPADRLKALWTSIGAQEDAMAASVSRAAGALDDLGRASQATSSQLGQLQAGSQESARMIGESAALMKQTLAREAQEMHKLVDELVSVLEERIELVGRN